MSKKVSKQYNQVFIDSYAEIPYITKSPKGPNYVHCTACNGDIKISHGGKSDITEHIETKKHRDFVENLKKIPKIGTFFNTSDSGNEVTTAECLFASFILEHNLPIAIADHAGQLFKKMFPKCDTAKKFACGRTKTTAIIKEMASESKKSLVNHLKNTVFSISVDGSNDSDSQLYPIVAIYKNKEGRTENSLLALPVLAGKSTGQNIGNLVIETLSSKGIDLQNCVAFSADNAPVMIGQKNGVAAILKSRNEKIIVMGCICHLIHLSAEKAAKSLPVAIDDVLIDIYYYLEKSAKRKEEVKELQTKYDAESHKILKHVCTRWLSLGRSLKRLLEQWLVLTSFFKNKIKEYENSKKMGSLQTYRIPLQACTKRRDSSSSTGEHSSKKMKTESGSELKIKSCEPQAISLTREERIFMFLSSDVNKAYCLFLDYIIPVFEKTNLTLQSEAPKIHILNELLVDMLREILLKFVKPNLLKNSANLVDIKYADICNQKNDTDLMIGSATLKVVNTLATDEKSQFYAAIRKYFTTCCNYIRHKFPINSDTLLHAEVANIEKISNKSFSDVKYFLDIFPAKCYQNADESEDETIDKLSSEFCAIQIAEMPEAVIKEERMDEKWNILGKLVAVDGSLKYSKISHIMLTILSIPHSNAECERVFSSVRKTRTEFRSSLSSENLENILITKSLQKGHCFEQTFSKEFLARAKSATYKQNNQKNEQ